MNNSKIQNRQYTERQQTNNRQFVDIEGGYELLQVIDRHYSDRKRSAEKQEVDK